VVLSWGGGKEASKRRWGMAQKEVGMQRSATSHPAVTSAATPVAPPVEAALGGRRGGWCTDTLYGIKLKELAKLGQTPPPPRQTCHGWGAMRGVRGSRLTVRSLWLFSRATTHVSHVCLVVCTPEPARIRASPSHTHRLTDAQRASHPAHQTHTRIASTWAGAG
jgi:hypothetical protein